MNWKVVLLVLFLVALLLSSCMVIVERATQSAGTVVIRFSFPVVRVIPSENPVAGILKLSRGARTFENFFELDKDNQVTVNGLEEGLWSLSVKLLDRNGYTIYQGSAEVTVVRDKVTEVILVLTLSSADLYIQTKVESPLVDEIQILLESEGLIVSAAENLENGVADFQISDMKSSVWDLTLKLFSTGQEVLTKGRYGLELQPGRINQFDIVVDNFGDVAIKTVTEKLSPVSNVTAENLSEGIKITWQPASGAAGYDVYRKADNLWLKLNAESLTEPEYLDTDVVEGESYTYVVNAKSSMGLHSGFSESVTIVRDTRRVFVLTKEKRLFKLAYDDSGMLKQVQSTVINVDGTAVKAIHTLGDDLFVALSGSSLEPVRIERYSSTTFEKLSTYKIEGEHICSGAFFQDEFAFLLTPSKLYRLDLTTGQSSSVSLSSATKSWAVAGAVYLLTNQNNLLIISLDNLQQINQFVMSDDPSSVFARESYLFVCKDFNWVKVYEWNGAILMPKGSVNFSSAARTVEATESYAYIGRFDQKLEILNLLTFEWEQNSFSMTGVINSVKLSDGRLYVIAGKELRLYDVDGSNLAMNQIVAFDYDCLLVCLD